MSFFEFVNTFTIIFLLPPLVAVVVASTLWFIFGLDDKVFWGAFWGATTVLMVAFAFGVFGAFWTLVP